MTKSTFTTRLSTTTILASIALNVSSAAIAAPVLDAGKGFTPGVTINNLTGKGNVTVDQGGLDKAIVNWSSFDVKRSETVQFVQPSAQAIILNRVGDVKASTIYGTVSANGQVAIVNPNGVVFGKDAHVDVAGLIATSADIKDEDFLAGDLKFTTKGNKSAIVENRGSITVAEGGLAALVAPQVTNSGVIAARKGTVVLGAAEKVTLDMYGDGLVSFALDGKALEKIEGRAAGENAVDVTSTGSVVADGGRVYLLAKDASAVVDQVINVQGSVQANTLTADGDGVVLGAVEVNSGRANTLVGGSIKAEGSAEAGTKGGSITLKGKHVTVKHNTRSALVSADGATGGEVLLKGTDSVAVGHDSLLSYPDAVVSANGLGEAGRGGKVTVFASNSSKDGHSKVFANGFLQARGAASGGEIEVSGNHFDFSGKVDATSSGEHGRIVFDPAKIWINDGGFDGMTDHVAEEFIEAQSLAGTDVILLADKQIRLNNLTDDSLTGGSGSISLRTRDNDGLIDAASKMDSIRTTSGEVFLTTGSGGIDLGSIYTGGSDEAGAIRLITKNGGAITVRDLMAEGGRGESLVSVNAAGDLTAKNISSGVSATTDVGDIKGAVVLKSGGNVHVLHDIAANASNATDVTAKSTASIVIEAPTGSITVDNDVSATASSAVGGTSNTHAFIRMDAHDNIDVDHTAAHSDGGSFSHALVTYTAPSITIRDDIESLATVGAGFTKDLGEIQLNGDLSAYVKDNVTDLHATTTVDVNGDITAVAVNDALVGTQALSDSTQTFRMIAGDRVSVVGNIRSLLANIWGRAGKGGITTGDIATGDNSGLLYDTSLFGYNPGDINLKTAAGSQGAITVGALSARGTGGDSTIMVNADGDAGIASLSQSLIDNNGDGSVGSLLTDVRAGKNIIINGPVSVRGEDDLGSSRQASATVNLIAGEALRVIGDTDLTAIGGDSGVVGDPARAYAEANFYGSTDVSITNADVIAHGGTTAQTILRVDSKNTVTVGELNSEARTSDHLAGAWSTGAADAYLSIVALGTDIEDDSAITYLSASQPVARANSAFRQNRYDDVDTDATGRAEISIVKLGGSGGGGGGGSSGGGSGGGTVIPPVITPEPPEEGTVIPPVVTPTPTPAAPAAFSLLEELALSHDSTFSRDRYSYYGNTMGDPYYYGNTNVNLTLLSGSRNAAAMSANMTAEALGAIAPAAGGNASANGGQGSCANNYLDQGFEPNFKTEEKCREDENALF